MRLQGRPTRCSCTCVAHLRVVGYPLPRFTQITRSSRIHWSTPAGRGVLWPLEDTTCGGLESMAHSGLLLARFGCFLRKLPEFLALPAGAALSSIGLGSDQ